MGTFDEYPPVTPYLAVHDAAKAIDFYKAAFDAKELPPRRPEDTRRSDDLLRRNGSEH